MKKSEKLSQKEFYESLSEIQKKKILYYSFRARIYFFVPLVFLLYYTVFEPLLILVIFALYGVIRMILKDSFKKDDELFHLDPTESIRYFRKNDMISALFKI